MLAQNLKMMKHILHILVFALLSGTMLQAQVSFGVKAGISPDQRLFNNQLFINSQDPVNEFIFNTKKLNNSIQAGFVLQAELDEHFFLEGQALYQYTSVQYSIDCLGKDFFRSGDQATLSEHLHRLTIPTAIGVHIGSVDIKSGFLTHFRIHEDSGLASLEGFQRDHKKINFGIHSAVALNLPGASLELGYQLDFENFGENRYVNGQSLAQYNAPGRLFISVGYGL